MKREIHSATSKLVPVGLAVSIAVFFTKVGSPLAPSSLMKGQAWGKKAGRNDKTSFIQLTLKSTPN
jgi:hypothetical protein